MACCSRHPFYILAGLTKFTQPNYGPGDAFAPTRNCPERVSMSQSQPAEIVTQANFSSAVLERSKTVPVLVDFWAAWCGPCHMLMPILAKLAEEYQGKFHLAKVNTDEEQALAAQYGVRSLPTVKVFKGGKIVDEFMGAQPESAVRQIIERHIERPADPLLRQ